MDSMSAGGEYEGNDHELCQPGHPDRAKRIPCHIGEERPIKNITEVGASLCADDQTADDACDDQAIHCDDGEARERSHEGLEVETAF